MELRQLQYFVAVVEEANFTRAAERLHVAQPGVSAQVRQLERELGQPLLDRSGRSVRLTEAGAGVLPYARAALGAVEGVRQVADEFTGLLRGRVMIGMVSAGPLQEFDVAAILAGFHADHPQVEIALAEDTSDRMLAALARGDLDIAVAGLTTPEPPPGISHQVLIDEALVAAVAPADPLAARASLAGGPAVPLALLADRPLISLPRGTGLRAVLDRAFADAGMRPRIAFEAAAPHVLAQFAAHGLGVAVLPEGIAAAAGDELRVLEIVQPRLRGQVALAWRAGGPPGPAARAFLGRLQKALATSARTGPA
jgi:DNA-binding transcriptional LysR family regulator